MHVVLTAGHLKCSRCGKVQLRGLQGRQTTHNDRKCWLIKSAFYFHTHSHCQSNAENTYIIRHWYGYRSVTAMGREFVSVVTVNFIQTKTRNLQVHSEVNNWWLYSITALTPMRQLTFWYWEELLQFCVRPFLPWKQLVPRESLGYSAANAAC